MSIEKLSQDEIDQLEFDGDLTAPDYDSLNVHGNLSIQLPGGAVAICTKSNLPNTNFYIYTAGSTGPLNSAFGGAGAYHSPNVNVQGGGGGATGQYGAAVSSAFSY
jgi:hypothetical protein